MLYLWIPDKRLKWYGIEPLAETDEKNLADIYGDDCKCEFNCDFKCNCGWNENITLKEHKSFQDLRIVSKPGILRQPYLALLIIDWKIKP